MTGYRPTFPRSREFRGGWAKTVQGSKLHFFARPGDPSACHNRRPFPYGTALEKVPDQTQTCPECLDRATRYGWFPGLAATFWGMAVPNRSHPYHVFERFQPGAVCLCRRTIAVRIWGAARLDDIPESACQDCLSAALARDLIEL